MSEAKIRVAIIEDELILSRVLKAWIVRFRDLEVVGTAADGEAGLALCREQRPDIAVVDIRLPKLDGVQLMDQLAIEFPQMRLLAMTGLVDAYTVWRVIQSGAHGFIEKSQPPEQLVEAIRMLGQGNAFFGQGFSRIKQDYLSQPEAFHKILSEREQQVLKGVVTGCEDAQISVKLGISPATVEVHRKRIRQKLGVHNDRGLLAYARKWGLAH